MAINCASWHKICCVLLCGLFLGPSALSLPWVAQSKEHRPLTKEDRTYLDSLPIPRSLQRIGFHYRYVKRDGSISTEKGAYGSSITIMASPKTKLEPLLIAAKIVSGMTKHMPDDIFLRTAKSTRVGVFTREEHLTVFPEFSHLTDDSCGTSCKGPCKHTCTFDGRKWITVNGITGSGLSAVLDQNIVCGLNDPQRHHMNTVMHEFGHGVGRYVMKNKRKRLEDAYSQAKEKQLWKLDSYAMANVHEYIATATCVFFNGNRSEGQTGGMSVCSGTKTPCTDEKQARSHLRQQDNDLFQLLNETFTGGHPEHLSGLSVCVKM